MTPDAMVIRRKTAITDLVVDGGNQVEEIPSCPRLTTCPDPTQVSRMDF